MSNTYEVKTVTEDNIVDFLLKFYNVRSLDDLIERNRSGWDTLKNFKYMNDFVWNGSNHDKYNPEGCVLTILIDTKKHEIAGIVNSFLTEDIDGTMYEDIAFVNVNESYSDERAKEILPYLFDSFVSKLPTKNLVTDYFNDFEEQIGMSDILQTVCSNYKINFTVTR